MLKGFRSFLLRGDVIVIAVGLVVALAFSNLVKAFTDSIINPLGLGWQLGSAGNKSTFLDVGAFISAIIYFLVFIAVVYFVIVLPYKHISARRGVTVFGEPGPTTTCPACLSDDLPAAASKCKYCGTDLAASGGRHEVTTNRD
jgi:large conductance mechanosensitive channel